MPNLPSSKEELNLQHLFIFPSRCLHLRCPMQWWRGSDARHSTACRTLGRNRQSAPPPAACTQGDQALHKTLGIVIPRCCHKCDPILFSCSRNGLPLRRTAAWGGTVGQSRAVGDDRLRFLAWWYWQAIAVAHLAPCPIAPGRPGSVSYMKPRRASRPVRRQTMAWSTAERLGAGSRRRHIQVAALFVQELVQQNALKVGKVLGHSNLANCLTKHSNAALKKRCLQALSMADMSTSDLRQMLNDAAQIELVASLMAKHNASNTNVSPWKPNFTVALNGASAP